MQFTDANEFDDASEYDDATSRMGSMSMSSMYGSDDESASPPFRQTGSPGFHPAEVSLHATPVLTHIVTMVLALHAWSHVTLLLQHQLLFKTYNLFASLYQVHMFCVHCTLRTTSFVRHEMG